MFSSNSFKNILKVKENSSKSNDITSSIPRKNVVLRKHAKFHVHRKNSFNNNVPNLRGTSNSESSLKSYRNTSMKLQEIKGGSLYPVGCTFNLKPNMLGLSNSKVNQKPSVKYYSSNHVDTGYDVNIDSKPKKNIMKTHFKKKLLKRQQNGVKSKTEVSSKDSKKKTDPEEEVPEKGEEEAEDEEISEEVNGKGTTTSEPNTTTIKTEIITSVPKTTKFLPKTMKSVPKTTKSVSEPQSVARTTDEPGTAIEKIGKEEDEDEDEDDDNGGDSVKAIKMPQQIKSEDITAEEENLDYDAILNEPAELDLEEEEEDDVEVKPGVRKKKIKKRWAFGRIPVTPDEHMEDEEEDYDDKADETPSERVWRKQNTHLFKYIKLPMKEPEYLQGGAELSFEETRATELRKEYYERVKMRLDGEEQEFQSDTAYQFIQPKANRSFILRMKNRKRKPIITAHFEKYYKKYMKPPFKNNFRKDKC